MVKVILSWIFYAFGDICSRVIWGEGRWADAMFYLYQWAMRRSVDFQGDGDRGPWERVKSETSKD